MGLAIKQLNMKPKVARSVSPPKGNLLYGLNDTGWANERVPVYAVIWPVKEPLIVPVLIENVAEELPARTVTVAGMIR